RAYRKRGLSAVAAGHLWRNDGFHLSRKQVWGPNFLCRVAGSSARAGVAGQELATARRRYMGGPWRRPRIPALARDVLGGFRSSTAPCPETLAFGASRFLATHPRRDTRGHFHELLG